MKDIKIIEVDGIKYITSNEKIKIGDAYVFLDEDTNIWGMVDSLRQINAFNPKNKRKIISMTN